MPFVVAIIIIVALNIAGNLIAQRLYPTLTSDSLGRRFVCYTTDFRPATAINLPVEGSGYWVVTQNLMQTLARQHSQTFWPIWKKRKGRDFSAALETHKRQLIISCTITDLRVCVKCRSWPPQPVTRRAVS